MNWLRTAGFAIAGFLVMLGLQMYGRDGRKVKRAEDRETAFLIDGSAKAKAKADKENAKATVFKERAKEADKATKAKLNEIDAKDTDMGDLLSAYHAERLRQSNP